MRSVWVKPTEVCSDCVKGGGTGGARGAIAPNISDEGATSPPPPPPNIFRSNAKKIIRFAPVKNILRSVKLKVTIWKN